MIKFFLFLFTPMFLCAQQTKVVIKNIDDTGIKQVYSVIDFSDSSEIKDLANKKIYPEIMHGSFQTFYHDTLLAEGFYKFGMKDSIWKDYNLQNGSLKSIGTYYYGKKDGMWTYNSNSGTPVRKVNEFSGETTILDSVLHVEEKDNRIYQSCDVPPKYRSGDNELMEFLARSIKYPKHAKENNIQGRVYVTFVIDQSGKVVQPKILRGIGGGCDEEALRVINLLDLNNSWQPGYQNGEAVMFQYILPIISSLN